MCFSVISTSYLQCTHRPSVQHMHMDRLASLQMHCKVDTRMWSGYVQIFSTTALIRLPDIQRSWTNVKNLWIPSGYMFQALKKKKKKMCSRELKHMVVYPAQTTLNDLVTSWWQNTGGLGPDAPSGCIPVSYWDKTWVITSPLWISW